MNRYIVKSHSANRYKGICSWHIAKWFFSLLFPGLMYGWSVQVLAAGKRPALTMDRTSLLENPQQSSAVITQIAGNQAVQILRRQGGWYQIEFIQSGTEKTGWVKMLALRFPAESSQNQSSGVGSLLSLRQGHSNITATTGVRGIGEADIKNSKPDFVALMASKQFQTTKKDARKFAEAGHLKSQAVAYPEVK